MTKENSHKFYKSLMASGRVKEAAVILARYPEFGVEQEPEPVEEKKEEKKEVKKSGKKSKR